MLLSGPPAGGDWDRRAEALLAAAAGASMATGARLGELRRSMAAAEMDALVVSNLTNVRYLCGFSGSAGLLVVTPDQAVLITDGRYGLQAPAEIEAAGAEVEVQVPSTAAGQMSALAALIGSAGSAGLEAEHASWAFERRLAAALSESSSVQLVPAKTLVEEIRVTKDDGELVRMAAAAAVADAALARMLDRLQPGRSTEADFALGLDTEMRRLGAQRVAFETIVAAGMNGAKPHHQPSSKVIEAGELVVIDFGATVDGYRSDMTRTICAGDPASETLAEIAAVVATSQAAGVAAVGVGSDAKDVDAACRTIISQAGFGEAFVHSTGHGVGLDVHESPAVAQRCSAKLKDRSVVTVEPGIYLEGLGGCRIEDTVVVTPSGAVPLTGAPKQLVLA